MIRKFYNAFAGLLLMLRYSRVFDTNILQGKRVAIVGPAGSAFQVKRGNFIDGFDYVIRINKAPFLLKSGKSTEYIGTKTDILFHSFFENEFSGGGPLDFPLYQSLGIKFVINPIPTFFGKRVTFNFFKKYLLPQLIYSLPAQPYERIVKAFGRFRPTTGFCALQMALESDCSELFITGFTFFKTAYGDGYRDQLKDVSVNKKYINESNIHNPDIEYEQFKMMLGTSKVTSITIDAELKRILAQDGVLLNEAS
jgi:hypothetical protein